METDESKIRKFVRDQLRACSESDLSNLTVNVLKQRYLAYSGQDTLSPDDKQLLKCVVKEELTKMPPDSDQEAAVKTPQHNKRKREEADSDENEGTTKAGAKKPRPNTSTDSKRTGDTESSNDDGEVETKKGNGKGHESDSQSSDVGEEELRVKKEPESDQENSDSPSHSSSGDEPKRKPARQKANQKNMKQRDKKIVPKAAIVKKEESGNDTDSSDSDLEEGTQKENKKISKVDRKGEDNSGDASEHDSDGSKSSGKGEERKKVKEDQEDSDSSSLPSLDSDTEPQQAKKKKSEKSEGASKGGGESKGEQAIARLKHYISLCGVRKNYKKLFEDCRSTKSKVNALKKELENLGVHGRPTIQICKKIRLKREQDQEIAELDVGNIITTQGRPKRNTGWSAVQSTTPSAPFKRAVNSSSDSDEGSRANKGKKRVTDWGNLQGIISDDGDSD